MAYVDKMNVQGTDYDIRDKRIAGTEDVNVKPIYYHGLHGESGNLQLQFTIFNNSNTPFTKDTALAKIKELMDNGAIINCNGALKTGDNVYPVYLMVKSTGTYYLLYHTPSDIQELADIDTFWNDIFYFTDGVNKIN